jgi:uncharacterized protein DUF5615
MLKLAADENLNNDILRGLLRRNPGIDVVRVQDIADVAGQDDATVLAWAAREGRVPLTHDVRTITRHANERVEATLQMPGVFEIPRGISLATVIEDLLLIATCSVAGEWEGQVRFLPLQ